MQTWRARQTWGAWKRAGNLPTVRTVADWNTKKGVVAKLTTATGIGAALVALRTAWFNVDWDKVDLHSGLRKYTPDHSASMDSLVWRTFSPIYAN